jgi:hypothetical protein
MPLLVVVTGLVCLAQAVALWFLAVRHVNRTRNETERTPQVLNHRLLAIESRVAELDHDGRQDPTKHAKPPGHAAAGEAKRERRPQSLLEVRNVQDARNEPTLIVIPDLGTDEQESQERAASELGERHGEAWTLAAAGVPPEEIARQTGQPIGRIELIVALYRRLLSSRGSIDNA